MIGDYFLGKPVTFQVFVGAVLVTGAFIVVGIHNSKPKEGEVPLAEDLPGDGTGEQAQLRLGEAVPRLESQADTRFSA